MMQFVIISIVILLVCVCIGSTDIGYDAGVDGHNGKTCPDGSGCSGGKGCKLQWYGQKRCGKKKIKSKCNSGDECISGRCAGGPIFADDMVYSEIKNDENMNTYSLLAFCAENDRPGLHEWNACLTNDDCGTHGYCDSKMCTCKRSGVITEQQKCCETGTDGTMTCKDTRADIAKECRTDQDCLVRFGHEGVNVDMALYCNDNGICIGWEQVKTSPSAMFYGKGRTFMMYIAVQKVQFLCPECDAADATCVHQNRKMEIDKVYEDVHARGPLDDLTGNMARCHRKNGDDQIATFLAEWCEKTTVGVGVDMEPRSQCDPYVRFRWRKAWGSADDSIEIRDFKLTGSQPAGKDHIDYFNIGELHEIGHALGFTEQQPLTVKIIDLDIGTDDDKDDTPTTDKDTGNDDLLNLNFHPAVLAQMHFEEQYSRQKISDPTDFSQMNCGALPGNPRSCFGTIAVVAKGNRLGLEANRNWPLNIEVSDHKAIPYVGVQVFYLFLQGFHDMTGEQLQQLINDIPITS